MCCLIKSCGHAHIDNHPFVQILEVEGEYVYPYFAAQAPEEDLVTICNYRADSPLYVWLDERAGDLQAWKRVWSYMTPNVLTEPKCR